MYRNYALHMADKSRKSFLQTFGRQLQRERVKQNISQVNLAIRAGMGPNYISELEQGRRDVKLSTVARLADVLNIRPYQLLQ
jgi:transcriptional regulator with XRE-family HTH domain